MTPFTPQQRVRERTGNVTGVVAVVIRTPVTNVVTDYVIEMYGRRLQWTAPVAELLLVPADSPRPNRRRVFLIASPNAFGGILGELRDEVGLTKRALGKLSNVDPAYLSRIEGGKQSPGFALAVQLLDRFGFDLVAVERPREP